MQVKDLNSSGLLNILALLDVETTPILLQDPKNLEEEIIELPFQFIKWVSPDGDYLKQFPDQANKDEKGVPIPFERPKFWVIYNGGLLKGEDGKLILSSFNGNPSNEELVCHCPQLIGEDLIDPNDSSRKRLFTLSLSEVDLSYQRVQAINELTGRATQILREFSEFTYRRTYPDFFIEKIVFKIYLLKNQDRIFVSHLYPYIFDKHGYVKKLKFLKYKMF